MQELCYELNIEILDAYKEAFKELLNCMGEHSFIEGSIDCDIEFDYNNSENDYYADLNVHSPIIFYSENLQYLNDLVTRIKSEITVLELPENSITYKIDLFKDQDWRNSWKQSFQPVFIQNEFCILPPWEDPMKYSHNHKIIINPGMAFGTGQHETTKLCLELYLTLPSVDNIFDVGCGSGILAIAAAMNGAKNILGCDVDEDSIRISIENAEINKVNFIEFTSKLIADLPQKEYNLLFANIQIKPLLSIFDHMLKRTSPKGYIIISGILDTEADEFQTFMDSKKIKTLKRQVMGNWVGFLCQKN